MAQKDGVTTETDTKEAVKSAWMVVEYIPEIKDARIEVIGQLDKCCTDDTIIATISSSTKVATSSAMSAAR